MEGERAIERVGACVCVCEREREIERDREERVCSCLREQ